MRQPGGQVIPSATRKTLVQARCGAGQRLPEPEIPITSDSTVSLYQVSGGLGPPALLRDAFQILSCA